MNKQGSVLRRPRTLAICACLTALALALSYCERFIPVGALIPLPGIKLGLANIVTLFALFALGRRYALAVMLTRCLLSAIFSGQPMALLFSVCGGLLALLAMSLAMRSRHLSIYGVSILGAAAHNVGQIAAAMLIMHSTAIFYYLSTLLFAAIITGALTALAASGVLRALDKSGLLRKK